MEFVDDDDVVGVSGDVCYVVWWEWLYGCEYVFLLFWVLVVNVEFVEVGVIEYFLVCLKWLLEDFLVMCDEE